MRLLSGTGEELGVVVSVETDRWGHPKHLRFREPGTEDLRRAPLRFVLSFSTSQERKHEGTKPRRSPRSSALGPA